VIELVYLGSTSDLKSVLYLQNVLMMFYSVTRARGIPITCQEWLIKN